MNNKKPCSRLIISTIASTIAMYLGLLSGSARAVDQSTLGAHGGKVLSSGHGSVEVKLDRPSGQVSVYLSRKEEHPDGVVITFFNQGQPPFSLELKALTPEKGGAVAYQGQLNPNQQSYIGFELKIPFPRGRTEIIRDLPVEK